MTLGNLVLSNRMSDGSAVIDFFIKLASGNNTPITHHRYLMTRLTQGFKRFLMCIITDQILLGQRVIAQLHRFAYGHHFIVKPVLAGFYNLKLNQKGQRHAFIDSLFDAAIKTYIKICIQ